MADRDSHRWERRVALGGFVWQLCIHDVVWTRRYVAPL